MRRRCGHPRTGWRGRCAPTMLRGPAGSGSARPCSKGSCGCSAAPPSMAPTSPTTRARSGPRPIPRARGGWYSAECGLAAMLTAGPTVVAQPQRRLALARRGSLGRGHVAGGVVSAARVRRVRVARRAVGCGWKQLGRPGDYQRAVEAAAHGGWRARGRVSAERAARCAHGYNRALKLSLMYSNFHCHGFIVCMASLWTGRRPPAREARRGRVRVWGCGRSRNETAVGQRLQARPATGTRQVPRFTSTASCPSRVPSPARPPPPRELTTRQERSQQNIDRV